MLSSASLLQQQLEKFLMLLTMPQFSLCGNIQHEREVKKDMRKTTMKYEYRNIKDSTGVFLKEKKE